MVIFRDCKNEQIGFVLQLRAVSGEGRDLRWIFRCRSERTGQVYGAPTTRDMLGK